MFTGIIEDRGVVERVRGGAGGGRVLTIRSAFEPSSLRLGDSIAIDGVCLTATQLDGSRFSVDAGPETLARTTIGGLAAGAAVNLERAMAVGGRLGGHIVQGHVDGVGTLHSATPRENAWDLRVEAPAELMELIAPRGSITLSGISLTVTEVEGTRFGVSIIPHTWRETTLAQKRPGDRLNLEVDVLARYLARLLDARGLGGARAGLTEAELRAKGF